MYGCVYPRSKPPVRLRCQNLWWVVDFKEGKRHLQAITTPPGDVHVSRIGARSCFFSQGLVDCLWLDLCGIALRVTFGQ